MQAHPLTHTHYGLCSPVCVGTVSVSTVNTMGLYIEALTVKYTVVLSRKTLSPAEQGWIGHREYREFSLWAGQ